MKLLLIIYLFATLILSGCATLIGSSTQKIRFETNPSGVEASVNGQTVGTTPFELNVKKDQLPIIEFKKEGFEDQSVSIHPEVGQGDGRWWIVSDVLGGLILLPTTFAVVNINTPGNFFDKSNNPSTIGVVLGIAAALTPLVVDVWTKKYVHYSDVSVWLWEKGDSFKNAWSRLHAGMDFNEVNHSLHLSGSPMIPLSDENVTLQLGCPYGICAFKYVNGHLESWSHQ